MAHRAVAIANAFLAKPGALGNLTQMQLQKLAYIADGWNMAINGDVLVRDTARAWDYGPVFPDLYDHTKFFGARPIDRLITPDDDDAVRFFTKGRPESDPYQADLDQSEQSVIDHVWSRYGKLSGAQLSRLTHQPGTPWSNAYARGKNSQLDTDEIREHYISMAERAEAASRV